MVAVPVALQYALIGAAVALSLWVVLNQQMPGQVRRLRVAIALRLLRDDRAWAARLARAIAPQASAPGACGGCNGCGSSATASGIPDMSGQVRPQ